MKPVRDLARGDDDRGDERDVRCDRQRRLDGSTDQAWAGFGGTFNEKGWEALSALGAEDGDRALKLLFDAKDGAKFIYGRVPIGASDYATDRYTLSDTSNDTGRCGRQEAAIRAARQGVGHRQPDVRPA
ncbi:hypothetical protein WMF04_35415 [Sorangium sp. So ce260]|uniref:hypothetical protein n=1 Tax=Sorangium sp. So ce260 TaxID=3133291 RepID=UPI003F607EF3